MFIVFYQLYIMLKVSIPLWYNMFVISANIQVCLVFIHSCTFVWMFVESLSLDVCVFPCVCLFMWVSGWPCYITPISLVGSISANWIKVKCSTTERESKWTVSVITAYLICLTHTRTYTHHTHVRTRSSLVSSSIKGNWKWVSGWTGLNGSYLNCNTEFITNLYFCPSLAFQHPQPEKSDFTKLTLINHWWFTHFSSKRLQWWPQYFNCAFNVAGCGKKLTSMTRVSKSS